MKIDIETVTVNSNRKLEENYTIEETEDLESLIGMSALVQLSAELESKALLLKLVQEHGITSEELVKDLAKHLYLGFWYKFQYKEIQEYMLDALKDEPCNI